MLILLRARISRPYISNKTPHAIAVASSHVNFARRASIFEERRSARGNEMVIAVRAGEHARATAGFYPCLVRKVRHDDIGSGLGQMMDSGGDQSRRVRRAPEAVHQCAHLQIAEVMIVFHLLTRHEYPPDILADILADILTDILTGATFRALSPNPEPSEAGFVGRMQNVQSRCVRPHRYAIVRKAILEDPVRPGAESLLHRALISGEDGVDPPAQREQPAQPRSQSRVRAK